MATIVFSLSSVEGIQRFHDLAESLLEMHDGLSSNLLEKLADKAEALGVHRTDVQRILLEIVRAKSPLGSRIIQQGTEGPEQLYLNCPRCDALYKVLVTDCPVCRWSFSFCLGVNVEDTVKQEIKEIEIARKVWSIREKDRSIPFFCKNIKLNLTEEIEIALKWLEQDAEIGFMHAQYNLGCAYRNGGCGISVNKQKAFEYLHKAAEQGHTASENLVGLMLYQGEGCEIKLEESVKWFSRAAEKGFAVAQYNLADSYENGKGIKQDYPQALRWYQKAAEQQHASAQNRIGLLYDAGKGVTKDYGVANGWFIRAALNGLAVAANNLGTNLKCGCGIDMNLYLARSLYKGAAKKGYTAAENRAAELSSIKAPWKQPLADCEYSIAKYQESVTCLGRIVSAIERFDSDDETIFDHENRLMWLRSGFSEKFTWNDAVQLINDLNEHEYAGYDDWRLPDKGELIALLELGSLLGIERYYHLFLNGLGFDGIKPGVYWSDGSEYEGRSYCANLKFGGISLHKDDEKAYFMIVRN